MKFSFFCAKIRLQHVAMTGRPFDCQSEHNLLNISLSLTHTHSCWNSLSLSLSLSDTQHTHSCWYSLSLSPSDTHTHSCWYSLSLYLSKTHTHTHSFSLSLTHSTLFQKKLLSTFYQINILNGKEKRSCSRVLCVWELKKKFQFNHFLVLVVAGAAMTKEAN